MSLLFLCNNMLISAWPRNSAGACVALCCWGCAERHQMTHRSLECLPSKSDAEMTRWLGHMFTSTIILLLALAPAHVLHYVCRVSDSIQAFCDICVFVCVTVCEDQRFCDAMHLSVWARVGGCICDQHGIPIETRNDELCTYIDTRVNWRGTLDIVPAGGLASEKDVAMGRNYACCW